jgi:hypothetical protein
MHDGGRLGAVILTIHRISIRDLRFTTTTTTMMMMMISF